MTPIDKLPDDILGEIFTFCLNERIVKDSAHFVTSSKPLPRTDVKSAPWTFTHVSQSWRCLGISLTHLWSYIAVIVPRDDNDQHLENLRERFQLQLQRTGDLHPLHISFTILGLCLKSARLERMKPLVQMLDSCSSRWAALHICLDEAVFRFLRDLEPETPQLHTLYINGSFYNDDPGMGMPFLDPSPGGFFIFKEASLLRTLGFVPNHFIVEAQYPWGQITHFDPTRLDYSYVEYPLEEPKMAFEFLGKMPNIERCSLGYIEDGEIEDKGILRLQRLKSLTLRRFAPGFMLHVVCPTLQSLRVFPGSFDGEDIATWLRQSQCNLSSLFISINPDDCRDYRNTVSLFDAVPELKSLSLVFTHDTTQRDSILRDDLFRVIWGEVREESNELRLLPNLREVILMHLPTDPVATPGYWLVDEAFVDLLMASLPQLDVRIGFFGQAP